MQSMDRIHRIGMIKGEKIPNVTYHIIIAKHTIDEKIRDRLDQKIKQMHRILESPDLVEFDYDESVVDSTGEEFENDYKSLVEHLKTLHKERENEA
jgi:SNF2 family DNA or RNA helicase